MKHPEIHPQADLEVSDALAYYTENAPSEIVQDFDAKIGSALIEIGQNPERYPRGRPHESPSGLLEDAHLG